MAANYISKRHLMPVLLISVVFLIFNGYSCLVKIDNEESQHIIVEQFLGLCLFYQIPLYDIVLIFYELEVPVLPSLQLLKGFSYLRIVFGLLIEEGFKLTIFITLHLNKNIFPILF